MSIAAKRFLDAISTAWDSLAPYTATAEAGELADIDSDALTALCDETGESYAVAEEEVMAAIRDKAGIPTDTENN